MPASGEIQIAVDFLDSTSQGRKTISKRLEMAEATDYGTATVALITGTVGTAGVILNFNPTTYRDATGAFVSFPGVTPSCRIALQADGPNPVVMFDQDIEQFKLASKNGRVAATIWGQSNIAAGVILLTYSGTNTYSVFVLDAG